MQTKPLALLIAASFSVAAIAPAPAYSAETATKGAAAAATPAFSSNPFYKPSSLFMHAPAFDKITNESYLPAFDAGMASSTRRSRPSPTTRRRPPSRTPSSRWRAAGQLLARTAAVFFNLTSCNTNAAMQKLQRAICADARRAQRRDHPRSGAVRAREAALRPARNTLAWTRVERLLWRYHRDFVRAGAKLSDADKAEAQGHERGARHPSSHLQPERPERGDASAVVVDKREELAGLTEARSPPQPTRQGQQAWTASTSSRLTNTTGQPPEPR